MSYKLSKVEVEASVSPSSPVTVDVIVFIPADKTLYALKRTETVTDIKVHATCSSRGIVQQC